MPSRLRDDAVLAGTVQTRPLIVPVPAGCPTPLPDKPTTRRCRRRTDRPRQAPSPRVHTPSSLANEKMIAALSPLIPLSGPAP
jgi:hypothetical protein